jgi:hypothetical protein
MKYRVLVDDSFYDTDQSRRYANGEYSSYAEALAVCEQIVDGFLRHECVSGMPASALYFRYMLFGKAPFIMGSPESPYESPNFSAWDYAKVRCEELCSRPAQKNGQRIDAGPDIEVFQLPSS